MNQFEAGSQSDEGPISSFVTYAAEGDILAKQGEYKKAIDSYTRALELKHGEKNCLVARSKCFLHLGDADAALKDSDAALSQDKQFSKGLYQKAEALYAKGDFEYALVFYHRGNKLRPELDEFRLGIQKSCEAIDNSIGNANTCNLAQTWRATSAKDPDAKEAKVKKGAEGGRGVLTGAGAGQRGAGAKGATKKAPPASDKTIKQLLGELYADKEYLEKLMDDQDFVQDGGDQNIGDLVSSGLQYLETRTTFWRQQKPLYARRAEQKKNRPGGTKGATQRGGGAGDGHGTQKGGGAGGAGAGGKKAKDQTQEVLQSLRKINAALDEGEPDLSLRYAKQFLRRLNEMDIEDKPRILGNVYSSMGSTYFELDNLEMALSHHEKDLKLAKENKFEDAHSRALGNIGRVHARRGAFGKAVACWTEKLPMTEALVEKAWLYHDIGRCHFSTGALAQAVEFGNSCIGTAKECNDPHWHLNGCVLVGEAYAKQEDDDKALAAFETAVKLASELKDDAAGLAVTKRMDDIHSRRAQREAGEAE